MSNRWSHFPDNDLLLGNEIFFLYKLQNRPKKKVTLKLKTYLILVQKKLEKNYTLSEIKNVSVLSVPFGKAL